jgi:hypothetical protein
MMFKNVCSYAEANLKKNIFHANSFSGSNMILFNIHKGVITVEAIIVPEGILLASQSATS